MPTPTEHLKAHRDAGRRFEAGGIESFVREEGTGEPVLCLHGVPTSSFLYRKVVPALAERGLRGVALDLPGLGLADRPKGFDYSWTGLGRWTVEAVDALGLDAFHLVVHDIGGPVGFEVAAAMPERVRTLTVLNTIGRIDGFRKPWTMAPFAVPRLGRLWLASMLPFLFVRLMYLQGVADKRQSPPEELLVHLGLLGLRDGGEAFLEIMRSFEPTADKQALYYGVLGDARYPKQLIWGERDPALRLEVHAPPLLQAAGLSEGIRLPAKHFPQEDQAPAIAAQVAALAGA